METDASDLVSNEQFSVRQSAHFHTCPFSIIQFYDIFHVLRSEEPNSVFHSQCIFKRDCALRSIYGTRTQSGDESN